MFSFQFQLKIPPLTLIAIKAIFPPTNIISCFAKVLAVTLKRFLSLKEVKMKVLVSVVVLMAIACVNVMSCANKNV
jgi:hypothetical protein